MKTAALLTLAVLLALTAPATARAVGGERAGLTVGERVFGEPACGTPTVEESTAAEYEAAYGTGAFEDGEPLAWADESRCAIIINRVRARTAIRTAAKRCHVIVHEWGHLTGREHSDNERSVMYGEDNVLEGRERDGKRWGPWVASGAFRPCVEMTRPGVRVG